MLLERCWSDEIELRGNVETTIRNFVKETMHKSNAMHFQMQFYDEIWKEYVGGKVL